MGTPSGRRVPVVALLVVLAALAAPPAGPGLAAAGGPNDLPDEPRGQQAAGPARQPSGIGGSPAGGDTAPNASVTFPDQTIRATDEVVVVSVELAAGGFVAIHAGNASGPLVGASGYLDPGNHSNVSVSLDDPPQGVATLVAVPHRDTDDNRQFGGFAHGEDRPYRQDGDPVSDAATVRAPTPSPTPTGTPPATEPGTTRSPTERPETRTPSSSPGFGYLAGVLALAVALLATVRRT